MLVVEEKSVSWFPLAPGCPGLCSDTSSSALVRRPRRSGVKGHRVLLKDNIEREDG